MECVAIEAVDFKFPFTGKTYKKGEEFAYEIVYVGFFSFFLPFFFFAVVMILSAPFSPSHSLYVYD